MDNIDNKYNPHLCKILLAISDLVCFNVALWLSLGCVYLIFDGVQRFVPQEQLDTRVISHFILSIVCGVVLGSFASLYLSQAILV